MLNSHTQKITQMKLQLKGVIQQLDNMAMNKVIELLKREEAMKTNPTPVKQTAPKVVGKPSSSAMKVSEGENKKGLHTCIHCKRDFSTAYFMQRHIEMSH